MPTCAHCNAEGDSESTVPPLQKCSVCKETQYCSRECQVNDWKIHKRICQPPPDPAHLNLQSYGNIPKSIPNTFGDFSLQDLQPGHTFGVKLLHNAAMRFTRNRRFIPEQFEPTHPIFSKGELCPLTVLYGIPIILYSPVLHSSMPSDYPGAEGNNQPAVFLRIEVADGFAPPRWQTHSLDTCYAVRQDKKPLSKELLETMREYHSMLLDGYFEEILDGTYPPGHNITPQAFQKFADNYWKKGRYN